MTMIISDYLIVFKIPAFHRLIFRARKKVCVLPKSINYGEIQSPLMVFMCPVKVSLRSPEAKSQNLIVRSFDPETKN